MITRDAPEQRIVLRDASWGTYERLRKERGERPTPRFFYDRGVLEIMSPSFEHESLADVISSLVKELALVSGVDVVGAGSTTYARGDLSRGFEPDASFYFGEKAALVRGKEEIDLDAGDPAPDLVVEVDVTSFSLDKLPVYARLGVAEVWRCVVGRSAVGRSAGEAARSFEVLGLTGSDREYVRMGHSAVLPGSGRGFPGESPSGAKDLSAEVLSRFVEEGRRIAYPDWVGTIRRWASGR